MQQDDPRVDELRQQLRALGYLNAGVDRFVLGPARAARSPWSIAALSSLRVGLLAALLLGPAVAIGIGARLPGLVTGSRDAIVVALYLAVMFGIAATAFTFLASVAVVTLGGAAIAARARPVSRAAGTLVAISSLVYLTLWWLSANAEAWSSPVWTASALLVAVIVSLLLGHAVAITSFAVMVARHPQATATAPSRSATRLVVAAGVVAFVGAATLLLVAAPRDPSPTDVPHLAVVSPGYRVRVIAIDGFDAGIFDSLRAEGKLPVLGGAFTPISRVDADDSHDPARAWTTIATGQPPDVHGVQSLETRRVAGLEGTVASREEHGISDAIRSATDLLRLTRPAVASGVELRAKPFWEVASQAGLRTVVVNWWATWPAGAGGANAPVILSDRATLRLERGGELDAEIAPKETYEKLRGAWGRIKEQAAATAKQLSPQSTDPTIVATLRRSAELDALQILLLQAVDGDATDLVAVYLPGLDIVQHTLLQSRDNLAPSAMATRLGALRSYYEYLDSAMGALLGGLDNETVVLVTQPGRVASKSPGLFGIAGRMSDPKALDAKAIDIAPTVLHALGVPISREMPGRPRTDLLAPSYTSKFPVREVPTYGPRVPHGAIRRGQPLDDEMVERLRSLGYVR